MPDEFSSVVEKIKAAGWWQGSVISAADLQQYISEKLDSEFWVIASQTCNLYNPSHEKVPCFELVGARRIDKCQSNLSKGDHPRALHVEAIRSEETVALELNVLQRRWLDRRVLGEISKAHSEIVDAIDPAGTQWLDRFSGWLARSYTRVTLPDHFNTALQDCRLKKYLEGKLINNADQLYGIYFSISHDDDDEFKGALGLMPPPYILDITVVCHEDFDPEPLKSEIVKNIFDETKVVGNIKKSIADLAREHGIRLSKTGVTARTTESITLAELRSLTRYSFVDHLSDSSYSHSD